MRKFFRSLSFSLKMFAARIANANKKIIIEKILIPMFSLQESHVKP